MKSDSFFIWGFVCKVNLFFKSSIKEIMMYLNISVDNFFYIMVLKFEFLFKYVKLIFKISFKKCIMFGELFFKWLFVFLGGRFVGFEL